MKWIILIAIVIALGILGYGYVMLNNTPPANVQVSNATSTRSITVYHAFKDGEHRFTGQVKLPHSCYAFDAEAVRDDSVPNGIVIEMTATDKMLDQSICEKIPTNYPFQILAEQPGNATVRGVLNGQDVAVKLIETDWESGAGNLINPINNN